MKTENIKLKIFGLLSSSLLTQLILIATQFILLPIQLQRWGHSATANWYAGLAVAAIATIADGGLRTIGHDALIHADEDGAARERFLQAWLICRLLILTATVLLISGNLIGSIMEPTIPFSAWRGILIVAVALETLMVVRIVYMDSLGLYDVAEFSYLSMVVLRLAMALVAIFAFDGRELLLACAYLSASVIGIAFQERSCCSPSVLALTARPRCAPSLRFLSVLRFTVADPVASWMRLNLPVLIIVTIGTDYAITAFVALRAIFGAMRNVLHQLARAGSVEFTTLARIGRSRTATDVLRAFLIGGTWIAGASSVAVLIDDYTLTRYWLDGLNIAEYRLFALTLALGAVFYPYQLLVSVQIRSGHVAKVAVRQYAWITASTILLAVSLATASLTVYAWLLAAGEILIGLLFYLSPTGEVQRRAARDGLIACAGTMFVIAAIGLGLRLGVVPAIGGHPIAGVAVLLTIASVLAVGPGLALVPFMRGRGSVSRALEAGEQMKRLP